MAPYPPSPPVRGLLGFLLGNALDLPDPAKDSHIDIRLMEWSKKYGRIISFTVPFVGRFIVIGDPDLAKYVLITKNYRKSPTMQDLTDIIGERSILVSSDKEWAAKRRAFNPGFSPGFLKGVVDVIVSKCSRLLLKCARDSEHGVETNLHFRVVDFTSDVIAQVTFGEDWGHNDDEALHPTHVLMIRLVDEVVRNALFPVRKLLDIRTRWRVKRLVCQLDRDMQAVIERRMEKLNAEEDADGGNWRDILSIAMAQIRTDGESLNSEEVTDITSQLKTFYFAGHDTTSTLISWAVWLVAQNPDVAEKIREEAIDKLGDWAINQPYCIVEGSGGKGKPGACNVAGTAGSSARLPSYDAFQRCTYLEAVLKETLRLYPPAASARYCDDPTAEFGGYRLGPCVLYVCCYLLHRHPDLWDDPDKFLPDRFLRVTNQQELDSKFMPFSRGPRDCIGRYFAMLEAKIALAAFFLNFDVSVVDTNEQIAYRITSQPMNGCKVKFSKRTPRM